MTNSVVSTACSKTFSRITYYSESALLNRRFFVFLTCLTLSCLSLPVVAQPNTSCLIKKADTNRVHVAHVIDGDTVILANGERLRLIGIDTPEIGYKGKLSQPGAVIAREFVARLLGKQREYAISYGIERQDRHGRTLGHLFLEDGRNLQALILAQGYATPLNIPPNLYFSACYQQKVITAKQNRLGLWKLTQYQPISTNSLTNKARGYRIIYGRVSRSNNNASSILLGLDPHLTIRIKHDDLMYFPDLEFAGLVGRIIQVQGKVYRHHKRLQMQIRHRHDLQILTN